MAYTEENRLPEEALAAAQDPSCRQILAVRCTAGCRAWLDFYKRTEDGWLRIFGCDAEIGKNGAGKQQEGDMKTPLGTFALSTPFGIMPDPSEDDPQSRVVPGYLQLTENHYWCGQNGPHYNRLIDNACPPEGYAPSDADEHLIRYDPSYRYGMFIEYNAEGLPDLGSAIFLHCRGKSGHTAGCVAVDEAYMRELILEMKQGAKIVIYSRENATMKQVFLIGDSIRVGYDSYVQELLEGRARLYWSEDNARFVHYSHRYITEWARECPDPEQIDIVHWNNGLWDIIHIMGDDAQTPVGEYEACLRRVVRRIRRVFPNARIIFALTTSVIEERLRPDFMRYNAEIEAINAAAVRVMADEGIAVNDLYTVSRKMPDDLHSTDGTHFTEEGYRVLAGQVAQAIMSAGI